MKADLFGRPSKGRSDRGFRALVVAVGLLPLGRLVVLGGSDALGANPVEFVTRSTGTWALVLLCVTLCVSPVRRLSGWNRLASVRRQLGLLCFLYAFLHFCTYFWLDQWFDLAASMQDVFKRPFIAAGFAAFLVLVPLAMTSTDVMVRRLGRRWGALHRGAYLAALLAVLHFAWHKAGKNDLQEPAVYAALIASLLAWRAWRRWGASLGLLSRGAPARDDRGTPPSRGRE